MTSENISAPTTPTINAFGILSRSLSLSFSQKHNIMNVFPLVGWFPFTSCAEAKSSIWTLDSTGSRILVIGNQPLME